MDEKTRQQWLAAFKGLEFLRDDARARGDERTAEVHEEASRLAAFYFLRDSKEAEQKERAST